MILIYFRIYFFISANKKMEFINKIQKEHDIIESFNGKIIFEGKHSGYEKNKYYLVKNKNTEEEYYIIDCGKLQLVKVDKDNINKIISIKNSWYIMSNGYVLSVIQDKQIYMHAYLMNHSGNGKGQISVDHINQNKLDNRMCNLRLATQSEQNINKIYSKYENSKYNLNRPEGMENIKLPRNIEYKFEYRDKEKKTGIREYFVLTHPNCPPYGKKKCVVSSKSTDKTAIEKLNFIIERMKELDIEIKYY